MADKNKSAANSRTSERRMTQPQAPRSSKRSEAVSKAEGRGAAPVPTQLAAFEAAMKLFHARQLTEARIHLEKALSIAPGSDHIHYALALAQAFSGDFAGAHENLRRAIELEPRNRMMARQDADFAPLANQSPFRSLLYPEKNGR